MARKRSKEKKPAKLKPRRNFLQMLEALRKKLKSTESPDEKIFEERVAKIAANFRLVPNEDIERQISHALHGLTVALRGMEDNPGLRRLGGVLLLRGKLRELIYLRLATETADAVGRNQELHSPEWRAKLNKVVPEANIQTTAGGHERHSQKELTPESLESWESNMGALLLKRVKIVSVPKGEKIRRGRPPKDADQKKSVKLRRLEIKLSDHDLERIERLRHHTMASSFADVIRDALRVYEEVVLKALDSMGASEQLKKRKAIKA
jgi:hypothetical protein